MCLHEVTRITASTTAAASCLATLPFRITTIRARVSNFTVLCSNKGPKRVLRYSQQTTLGTYARFVAVLPACWGALGRAPASSPRASRGAPLLLWQAGLACIAQLQCSRPCSTGKGCSWPSTRFRTSSISPNIAAAPADWPCLCSTVPLLYQRGVKVSGSPQTRAHCRRASPS